MSAQPEPTSPRPCPTCGSDPVALRRGLMSSARARTLLLVQAHDEGMTTVQTARLLAGLDPHDPNTPERTDDQ